MRIYLNGQEIGISQNTIELIDTVSNLTFGVYSGGSVDPFKGALDEISIYNRALSADEIASRVNADSIKLLFDETPPTGTISINNGALSAETEVVDLYLAAEDPGYPSTGVAEMRFSNDNINWSVWEPYQNIRENWMLTPEEGVKTVYAQFKDKQGNTSKTLETIWGKQFGSQSAWLWRTAVGSDGSIYVTGSDVIDGVNKPFVAKYDSQGSEIWKTYFQGSGTYSYLQDGLALDAEGNVYVTGVTYFDYPDISNQWEEGKGVIAKFDTNGNLLGQSEFGENYVPGSNNLIFSNFYDVTVDQSGNIYVAGNSDKYSFPSWSSIANQAFVKKFTFDSQTNQFELLNTYDLEYENESWTSGIEVDSDNNIYVVGETYDSSVDQWPAFLMKLNSELGLIWERKFGAGDSWDWPEELVIDQNNNIYVGGYTSPNGGDGFVAKFDSNGDQQWFNLIGGGNYWDDIYGIAVDSTGNVYGAGDTSNSLFGQFSGGYDSLIVKYDSQGSLIGGYQFGGSGLYDGIGDIVTDVNDNLYVGGWSDVSLPGFSGSGGAFLAKFKPTAISDSIILAEDITPPEITVTSPEENKTYYTGEELPIEFTVTDDLSGIVSMNATINGPDGFSLSVQNNQIIDLYTLKPGSYNLSVTATDKAGNTSTKDVVFDVIDYNGPMGNNRGLYADEVVGGSFDRYTARDPNNTLGVPDNNTYRLGLEGSYIELKFTDNKIVDGPGADLAVFSNTYHNEFYNVYIKNELEDYIFIGKYRGKSQIDISGKGVDNSDTVKIETANKDQYPAIDAVQTIHPGPYGDIVSGHIFSNSYNKAIYATGPKDGKATIVTTQAFEVRFTDNVAMDGERKDLTVYEYKNDDYYYLDIDDGTGFKQLIGTDGKRQRFKGVESIDLAKYGIKQANAVRITASSYAEIDSVQAIHSGPYADAVISNEVDPRLVKRDDLNGNNALGPDDYGPFMDASTLVRPNKPLEFQFLDNEAINREGPDLAIFGSAPYAFKISVKEKRGDDDYIDITPPGGFSKQNKNIYLPDNILSIEAIKIEGIDSNNHVLKSIEALHPYSNKILTRLTSDYEVYPKDSTATITAHITPFETDKNELTLKAYMDNAPIEGTDTKISVENNRTAKADINFTLPEGKHKIEVKVEGEPEAEVGSISLIGGLQNAIDLAKDGDILMLSKGTFKESVNIDKSITLKGANNQTTRPIDEDTVIEGNGGGSVVDISKSKAGLYNLTIKGGEFGIESHNNVAVNVWYNKVTGYEKAGIYLRDMPTAANSTQYSHFEYNYIDYGQKIDCTGAYVYDKVAKKWIITKDTPVGIKIDNSNFGYVKLNKIINNVVGVKLTQSRGYVSSNLLYGNCVSIFRDPIGEEEEPMDIQGNEIEDTIVGIAFSQSDGSILNIFENTINDAKVGILGIAGTANIYNNQISNSDVGIYAPLETVNIYDNIYLNNTENNPSALPEEIKRLIKEELLLSVLSEPYYLSRRIDGYDLQEGIAASLKSKLGVANISLEMAMVNLGTSRKLAENNLNAAINKIGAFQNELKALKDKQITSEQKEALRILSEIFKRQLEYVKDN